jgi:hypothetical protein
MAPIDATGTLPSVIGVQVVPLSVVLNRPPLATSARRPDQPVAHALEQHGIDRRHQHRFGPRGLCSRSRRRRGFLLGVKNGQADGQEGYC